MIEAEIKEELKEKQRQAGKEAHRGKPKADGKVFRNNSEDLSPRRDAQREAAKTTGSNPHYVSDAERIKEASPETFDDVKAGKTTKARVVAHPGPSFCASPDASGSLRHFPILLAVVRGIEFAEHRSIGPIDRPPGEIAEHIGHRDASVFGERLQLAIE
jgi:hypothetical protein